MPIQHANRKVKQKRKTSFDWSDKRRHIYPDRVRIQFILTKKTNKARGRDSAKTE